MSAFSVNRIRHRYVRFRFGPKARILSYRAIGDSLREGVSLEESLRRMSLSVSSEGKNPGKLLSIVSRDWISSVADGSTFAKAVAGWVPEEDRIIIDAGERADQLARALDIVLTVRMSGQKIRKAIVSGMLHVLALSAVAIAFLFVFARLLSVGPQLFSGLFHASPA